MSRSTLIVLLALGATVVGFAIASTTRLDGAKSDTTPTVAAGPQTALLEWKETYGSEGERLVFTVDSLTVTRSGWTAQIGVDNRTKVAWEVAPGATPGGTFGLQLFETGDKGELDARNRRGTLPAVREADRYDPKLPPILEPDKQWEGTIAARGPLVAGSWARVVFGTLIAAGKAPTGFEDTFVWITDHAYRLRP